MIEVHYCMYIYHTSVEYTKHTMCKIYQIHFFYLSLRRFPLRSISKVYHLMSYHTGHNFGTGVAHICSTIMLRAGIIGATHHA